MLNLSPRRLLTRVGTGVAVIALVAFAGYSVGQTQMPQAVVRGLVINALDLRSGTRSVGRQDLQRRRPRGATVRVEKRASVVPTEMPQLPDDPMFRVFSGAGSRDPANNACLVRRGSAPASSSPRTATS